MVESVHAGGERLDNALRLARDLCMGTNAFYVSPTGFVRVDPSAAPGGPGRAERARSLARSCLQHGDAQGHAPFWSAEATEAGQVPDDALACVAVPLHAAGEFVGLIGVIDDWLPDLNEEQMAGLMKIAGDLGQPVFPPGPPQPSPPEAREPDARTATATGAYEAFLGEVADGLPDGVLVVREDGTVIFANQSITTMTGLSHEELLGADIGWVLSAEPLSESLEALDLAAPAPVKVADLLQAERTRCFLITATGAGTPTVDVFTRPISSLSAGECWLVVVRDPHPVTAIEQVGEELLEALRQGIVVCDAEGIVVTANTEGHRLSGLRHDDELVGRPYLSTSRLRSPDGRALPADVHPLTRALQGTDVSPEQVVVDDATGERRRVIIAAQPFALPRGPGAILTMRDVTLELEEEARLSHLALHDALTGLANRYLLDEFLDRALRDSRTRGGTAAAIFLDLDGFKEINDRFGHEQGDMVLAAVARRIQNVVRSSELVARIGGDEFVVACSGTGDPHEVELLVERLRKALAVPYQIGPNTLGVSASIGWVIADRRIDTPERLLSRADAEMYRTKRARSRARRARAAEL